MEETWGTPSTKDSNGDPKYNKQDWVGWLEKNLYIFYPLRYRKFMADDSKKLKRENVPELKEEYYECLKIINFAHSKDPHFDYRRFDKCCRRFKLNHVEYEEDNLEEQTRLLIENEGTDKKAMLCIDTQYKYLHGILNKVNQCQLDHINYLRKEKKGLSYWWQDKERDLNSILKKSGKTSFKYIIEDKRDQWKKISTPSSPSITPTRWGSVPLDKKCYVEKYSQRPSSLDSPSDDVTAHISAKSLMMAPSQSIEATSVQKGKIQYKIILIIFV